MRYFAGLAAALLLLLGCVVAQAQDLTDEHQLIESGRQIYQEGRLPDGTPVKAIVLGNVEVSGVQFTCLNCHRRSGLGGPEGTKYVLPTNGASLLLPRTDIYMPRPAYNEQTFASAMRFGKSPGGEYFDPIMPRFDLSDDHIAALFAYLKTISNEFSPGLSDDVLHVATVVSDKVPARDRQAMIGVIKKFFLNKNAETRHEKKRYDSGPFYQEYRNKAYRRWHLHVWELTGPSEGWQKQLEDYYREQPVFVMLSGLVNGSWWPVHQFSQKNRIPCLLPNTDLPVVEPKNDFYTIYYSKGLQLEAQVLEEHLRRTAVPSSVLQVYRAGSDGVAAAHFLRTTMSGSELTDFVLTSGSADWDGLAGFLRQLDPGLLVLWLDAEDLASFSNSVDTVVPSYLSSLLLGGDLSVIPTRLETSARALHVYNLPEDHRARFLRVAAWMRVNKVPLTNPRLQGQSYYACMLLNAGMKHIKRFFYRDFFLDLLDHGERMAAYSGNYPRLSFGPEQRFLAKGAYVINLKTGKAEWIVPDY